MEDRRVLERPTELHFHDDMGMYYCGKRLETPGHVYGPEIRSHYLFVLVNKGKAVLHGERDILFGEHDLLVMQPNERIHYEALEPWSICWLGLYGESVRGYLDLLGITPQNPILHISLYREVKTLMDSIYDASAELSLGSKLSVMGMIYEFFALLMQGAGSGKTDLINAARKMMDYNFCSPISVEQIARRLGVDPAYFSRRFAERTGSSPKRYLLEKRMERAGELLCHTDASVQDISHSVGYEDSFYFCRIFKKYTGLSPMEYRKTSL